MRFMIYGIAALTLTACSNANGAEQNLAQCRLDAHAAGGEKFQKNYVGTGSTAREIEDEAYGAFLQTCMEAKGFDYSMPNGDDDKFNDLCWIKRKDGGVSPAPWVGGASCYR